MLVRNHTSTFAKGKMEVERSMFGLLAAKPLVEHATFLLIIMILYLLLMLLLGYIAGRKTTDNSDDYMAAEGKMPMWLVTATILATFICGATIMGGGGVAYSDGFPATIADPFAACLCLIAGGFIFQGQIRRTGAVSPAAVYQNRYGVLGGAIAGVCTIMPMLFFAGAQVAATGKLFQIVLGWDFKTVAILSGIFVIVYTAFGGITAVVWTDFVQVGILIIGVIVIFPAALAHVNDLGGQAAAKDLLGHDWFSLGYGAAVRTDNLDTNVPGFEAIISYLGLWIGCSAGAMPGSDIMQRALVAKSPGVAKASAVLAGVLMTIIGFFVVYSGAWARFFVESGHNMFTAAEMERLAEDSELVMPLISTHLLPTWFTAIFYVGLLGAIMSSADTALFAPATIIANDIIRPLSHRSGKIIEDKKMITIVRICVIALGVIATLFGTFTQSVYTLEVIGFTVQIVLFFPLLLALYWKKSNRTGAIVAMIGGIIWCVAMMVAQGTVEPGPYYALALGPMALTLVLQVVVSLATAKKDPPVPLMARDGSVVKWPELGENKFYVE